MALDTRLLCGFRTATTFHFLRAKARFGDRAVLTLNNNKKSNTGALSASTKRHNLEGLFLYEIIISFFTNLNY